MSRAGVKKWKGFEREVARELRALAPSSNRCLQYQRNHGAPDVRAGALWVECKSGRRGPRKALESIWLEAMKRVRPGGIPAVVSKATHRGPKLVTLSLNHFLSIAMATPRQQRKLWRGEP